MAALHELVALIREEMCGCLFHITDEANLASIAEHGIISKAKANDLGIIPIQPGGNELTRSLDADYGLYDMVFLGFHEQVLMPKTPKYTRRKQPRVLQIDPNVLFIQGVKVALGRANHRGTEVVTAWQAPYKMDWEADRAKPNKNDYNMKNRKRRILDYEVLVPDCVPVNYILDCE
jgi:hypothetical protein